MATILFEVYAVTLKIKPHDAVYRDIVHDTEWRANLHLLVGRLLLH